MARAVLLLLVSLLEAGAKYPADCGQPAIPPAPPRHNASLPRIIHGEEAVPHSFPWQISIKGEIGTACILLY